MSLKPLQILFRVLDPLLLTLDLLSRFWLAGCDVLKQFVSARDATETPNSTSTAPVPYTTTCIWAISYVSWCCAVCNWSKVVSNIYSTAVSLFSTRTATFETGARAECAGIVGGSIQYLPASNVTSNCAFSSNWLEFPSDGVMHDDPYNSYLQALAVRCAVLSSLRPLQL